MTKKTLITYLSTQDQQFPISMKNFTMNSNKNLTFFVVKKLIVINRISFYLVMNPQRIWINFILPFQQFIFISLEKRLRLSGIQGTTFIIIISVKNIASE